MKRLMITLAILIVMALFAGWFVNVGWMSVPSVGLPSEITIPKGASTKDVRNLLSSKGLVVPWAYALYAKFDPTAAQPKAGSYQLRPGMSYHDIAQLLAAGNPRAEVTIQLIEGKTLDVEASTLATYGVSTDAYYALVGEAPNAAPFDQSLVTDFPFLKDVPKDASLEGYLFPDTYRVWKDQLLKGLIHKQLGELQTHVIEPFADQQRASGLSWHQIITLASIVESEVPHDSDRKVVAGVLLNRLKQGMKLQSDATVNYVTRAGHTQSTAEDLATNSPYNTYQHTGLPPGPISNPSLSALRAVLEPAASDYLFFLTDKEGTVYYGKTYQDHLRNRARVLGN